MLTLNYLLIFDNIILALAENIIILVFGIIIFSSLILFSGRGGKILDTTHKIITTIAAATIAYKNISDDSSSENDDDKNKKDDKKAKDNKISKDNSSNNNDNDGK
jgi:hypothetical protein